MIAGIIVEEPHPRMGLFSFAQNLEAPLHRFHKSSMFQSVRFSDFSISPERRDTCARCLGTSAAPTLAGVGGLLCGGAPCLSLGLGASRHAAVALLSSWRIPLSSGSYFF